MDMCAPLNGTKQRAKSCSITVRFCSTSAAFLRPPLAIGISTKRLWEKMRKHAIAAGPLH
jgi:hypothetical protein